VFPEREEAQTAVQSGIHLTAVCASGYLNRLIDEFAHDQLTIRYVVRQSTSRDVYQTVDEGGNAFRQGETTVNNDA
jgi:hypothetical protein